MQQKLERLDANESMFLFDQLKYMKTEVIAKEYTPITYAQLFPVVSVGAGFKSIAWQTTDVTGEAEIMANDADDSPGIDNSVKEEQVPIYDIGLHYSFSIKDIKYANRVGINLDATKAQTAFQIMEQTTNKIAFIGGAKGSVKVPGLLSERNYKLYNKLTATKAWVGATSDEICADVLNMLSVTLNNTKTLYPNKQLKLTLLLPTIQYALLLKRVPDTSLTIAEWLVKSIPNLESIEPLTYLSKKESGLAKDCAISYIKNPSMVTMEIPEFYWQLPPELRGRNYRVECGRDIAGLNVVKPATFTTLEGI